MYLLERKSSHLLQIHEREHARARRTLEFGSGFLLSALTFITRSVRTPTCMKNNGSLVSRMAPYLRHLLSTYIRMYMYIIYGKTYRAGKSLIELRGMNEGLPLCS